MISITTLDPDLASRMEPRAASPASRLATVRALSEAGVPAGVLVSPVIPGLTDEGIDRILEACAGAGATAAGYLFIRLPAETGDLFIEWLREHYPLRADRVIGLVRRSRGGRLNDPMFGQRMRGRGAYADMIRTRFVAARRRNGLQARMPPLDTGRFRRPECPGTQRRLFD